MTDFWLKEQDALLYLPISPRSDLHREIGIARALLTRLCALHGEPLGDIADTPPDSLFEQAMGKLARPLPDGRRLLIILDGVDEAADWRPLIKLFPRTPPAGLRVLVAARTAIGESDRGVWLDRLGWSAPGLAQVLDLDLLDPEAIRDAMRRLGAPLDQIANDALVRELHRVTDAGDPLLVGLWVTSLWQGRKQIEREAAERVLARLSGAPPGLGGFFDQCRTPDMLLLTD